MKWVDLEAMKFRKSSCVFFLGGEKGWHLKFMACSKFARVDSSPPSTICESNNCFTVVFEAAKKHERK